MPDLVSGDVPAIKRTEKCDRQAYDTLTPCQLHYLANRCDGCNGPDGDGTRTVYIDAPAGSVLLSPEQITSALTLHRRAADVVRGVEDPWDSWDPSRSYLAGICAVLDALGVER